jgi:hypothetical protein
MEMGVCAVVLPPPVTPVKSFEDDQYEKKKGRTTDRPTRCKTFRRTDGQDGGGSQGGIQQAEKCEDTQATHRDLERGSLEER